MKKNKKIIKIILLLSILLSSFEAKSGWLENAATWTEDKFRFLLEAENRKFTFPFAIVGILVFVAFLKVFFSGSNFEDYYDNNKKEDQELSGFKNNESTCWINAAITALLNVPLFRKTLLEENENTAFDNDLITLLYTDIVVTASSKDNSPEIINPETLCNVLAQKVPGAQIGNQSDSAEALLKIIDAFSAIKNNIRSVPQKIESLVKSKKPDAITTKKLKELKDKLTILKLLKKDAYKYLSEQIDEIENNLNSEQFSKNIEKLKKIKEKIETLIKNLKFPRVSSLFDAKYHFIKKCCICGNQSGRCDDVKITKVSIVKNKRTLQGSLEEFFGKREMIANDYRCKKCNQITKHVEFTEIVKEPKILIIQLKTYDYEVKERIGVTIIKELDDKIGVKLTSNPSFEPKKIDFGIKFPLKNLSLNKYLKNKNGKSNLYDSVAVITHHGTSVKSGHYTTYTSTHHFNDESVTKSKMLEKFSNGANKTEIAFYKRSTPYVLIYEKKDQKI